MDEKQLQALANELAKNLETPDDLSQFLRPRATLRSAFSAMLLSISAQPSCCCSAGSARPTASADM
ncbi:hypothetical protein H2P46_11820 [Mixta sp. Marseille-Q2057]|nr:hypothetical protein [Mixta mediterraneensis]